MIARTTEFIATRLDAVTHRREAALLAVWCSGNALVSINAVALHRARLVLGWVTAFGQVNCLIT